MNETPLSTAAIGHSIRWYSEPKEKTIEIKVTLLGTGTSQGIPVIGCQCPVCQSTDPKDKRLRTAALLQANGKQLAIDCGPDFREQMLRAKVQDLDAILLTHQHNDHIIGLDDVRPFNFMNQTDMPVYCTQAVEEELKQRFSYIFATENRYPGAPMVHLHRIHKEAPFQAAGLPIQGVKVWHGKMPVMGFRIGRFAYITDVREIPEEERPKLRGLHTLVLSALHRKPHHSHLTLEQALELIQELQPQQAYLTHISHRMGKHADVMRELPRGVELGYDGLTFSVEGSL